MNAQADEFAEALLQRCAELLYAEMKPQIEARTASRRREAAVTPTRPPGGNVVSLTAWRARRAA